MQPSSFRLSSKLTWCKLLEVVKRHLYLQEQPTVANMLASANGYKSVVCVYVCVVVKVYNMGTISICLERRETGWIFSLSHIHLWFSIRSVRKSIRLDSSCHLKYYCCVHMYHSHHHVFLVCGHFPWGCPFSSYFYRVKAIWKFKRNISLSSLSHFCFLYFLSSNFLILSHSMANNFQESCSILAGMIYFWFVPQGRTHLQAGTARCCCKVFEFFRQ